MTKTKVRFTIFRIIQGFIMGCGAILPGISGSAFSVIFGIYRPILLLLSKPALAIREYGATLIPAGIGWLAGFLWLAKIISILFSAAPVPTTMAFVGLVAGTLPDLMHQAGKEGRGRSSYISFAFAFILMLAFLKVSTYNFHFNISPTFGCFFICGIIWGLSILIPGFTSSTVLVSLGVFHVVAEGISTFDMSMLAPILLGMAITAALLSRVFNYLFENHYSALFHAVLGIVLASSIRIIPLSYSGIGEIAVSLLCLVFGVVLARLLGRLGAGDDPDEDGAVKQQ
ncbi:MAG: DUF368 domain-containing protein [Oscillospiraceae bacterium]|nr:DUF368 domain-containing protein [Oscillospiraceae bacterium]